MGLWRNESWPAAEEWAGMEAGKWKAEPPACEEQLAAARSCDSKRSSCPMKLKLGEMMLRRCFTNSKASSSFTRLVRMR